MVGSFLRLPYVRGVSEVTDKGTSHELTIVAIDILRIVRSQITDRLAGVRQSPV